MLNKDFIHYEMLYIDYIELILSFVYMESITYISIVMCLCFGFNFIANLFLQSDYINELMLYIIIVVCLLILYSVNTQFTLLLSLHSLLYNMLFARQAYLMVCVLFTMKSSFDEVYVVSITVLITVQF